MLKSKNVLAFFLLIGKNYFFIKFTLKLKKSRNSLVYKVQKNFHLLLFLDSGRPIQTVSKCTLFVQS